MSDTPPATPGSVPPVESEKDQEQQIRVETSATAIIDDVLKTVELATPIEELLGTLGKEAIQSEGK